MKENNKDNVKFPENRELRKLLRKGDMLEVARLSGNSISYVRGVLNGSRNNDEIIAWAKRIISDREKRINQIINPTKDNTIHEG